MQSSLSLSTTDIIVPVLNLKDYTQLFVDSVLGQDNFNLIIIDNGSENETKEYLQNLDGFNVQLIRNEKNLGYVKAINQGLEISKAPTIFLANNDTIFTPGLLQRLRSGLGKFDLISALSNNIGKKPDERLINYKLTNLDELNNFSINLLREQVGEIEPIEFVFGHCLMMKREVFDRIGFLDERFGIGNYDDVDYCRRARENGFTIGIRKDSFIYHFCHATFNAENIDIESLLNKNKKVYEQKWLGDS